MFLLPVVFLSGCLIIATGNSLLLRVSPEEVDKLGTLSMESMPFCLSSALQSQNSNAFAHPLIFHGHPLLPFLLSTLPCLSFWFVAGLTFLEGLLLTGYGAGGSRHPSP